MSGLTQAQRLERALVELATRQHGVVARRQLIALGLGKDAIKGRLRARRLLPLHRGVYAVGHMRLGLRGRWMAAVSPTGRRQNSSALRREERCLAITAPRRCGA